MIIKGYIYCVTCLLTGKLYFGQTVMSIEERWRHHKGSTQRGSDHKFHRAIRKYGEENFLVEEVLTVSAPTKEILKKKISESLCGERNPFFGKKHSEETRKKMSEAKRRNRYEILV